LSIISSSLKQELLDTLKRHEGVRSYAYLCPAGYWTIGVGRNVDEDSGRGLSEDEIEYLLSNDVELSTEELMDTFPWFEDCPDAVKIILINMHFNIGLSRLKGFKKMLAAVEDKNYGAAAKEMLDSRWAAQVGQRAVELSTEMKNQHGVC
jgi:lysozyme